MWSDVSPKFCPFLRIRFSGCRVGAGGGARHGQGGMHHHNPHGDVGMDLAEDQKTQPLLLPLAMVSVSWKRILCGRAWFLKADKINAAAHCCAASDQTAEEDLNKVRQYIRREKSLVSNHHAAEANHAAEAQKHQKMRRVYSTYERPNSPR